MKIYLLDMGRNKYGDCLLLVEGNHKILIDGGHPGDTASIRRQLSKILKRSPPFELDLLIVTHCHADHIGCLPDLVKLGDITPKLALVADEDLGWGHINGADGADRPAIADNQKILFAALQEEDRSDLSDDELEQFFFDAANLEGNYNQMLQALADNDCRIIRYGRHTHDEVAEVERIGAPFKLKILGPVPEHLQICAEAIGRTLGTGRDSLLSGMSPDAPAATMIETYRSLVGRFLRDTVSSRFAADQPGIGAAKNNQSIIVSVEASQGEGKWKALLAGDMQFAKAEVSGLDDMMQELFEAVNEAGPYDFIKLTHHASYNGTDDGILTEWNKHTKLFAHTGGWNDTKHPDGGVLRILEDKSSSLIFTRTDRNGMITVAWEDGELGMDVSKGEFNDFGPNVPADAVAAPTPPTLAAPQLNLTSVAQAQPSTSEGVVEVITRLPHTDTKVTVTIDVEPGKKKVHDINKGSDIPLIPTSRERLTGLLFVTSWKALQNNIGEQAFMDVRSLLQNQGAEVLDIPTDNLANAEGIAQTVRQRLLTGSIKGVVVLGGYDVIPAQKLDVLFAELRQELQTKRRSNSDADDFIVWSDDIYGDVNGDGDPELPVSRIPDGKDSQLVLKALSAPLFSIKSRFGVRNLARPFAHGVYQTVPGEVNQMEISESFSPQDVTPGSALGAVYYMLHGSDRDGTRFWGETADEDEFEAFSIENIPASAPGTVVFTGCCWGALPAEPIAFRKTLTMPMRPRTPNQSIALKYLQAGALAFVGATGSHYSPREAPYNYHGKPMHDSFWKAISEGHLPAQALFEAKLKYRKDYPHGETAPFSKAIELKTLRQFTCLGLGW